MRIDHTRRGDVTIVALEGDFDFHDVTSAADAIGAFIDKGAHRLVFDLRALEFISSGGIGYLVQTAKRLRGLGGELVLTEPPESLGWVVRTLGIDRVIRIFPGREDALRYLAGPLSAPEAPPRGGSQPSL